MKQYYLKIKILLFLFVALFEISNAQRTEYNSSHIKKYQNLSMGRLEFISINDYGTYKYASAVSPPGGDRFILTQEGKWKRNGDTLILNSYRKPNNYNLIKVKEKIDPKSDSIIIKIKNDSTLPFVPITCILINNKPYWTNKIKNVNVILKKQKINSILLRDNGIFWPIYYPKDINTNVYEITVSEPEKCSDIFSIWCLSYCIDEKFIIKGNDLIHLQYYGGPDEDDTFKKVDDFMKIDISDY